MNDSQEPSYYEIALTNRQVMVFFVVLLLCVVGAFFSGVWLGKQRAGDLPVVAQAPPPEVEEAEQETLAELNFFTDESASAPAPEGKAARQVKTSKKAAGSVASSGSPETTLVEDLNGSKPAESPRREASSAQPTPSAAAPAVAPGDFVIQVFSSPDGAQARRLLDRLTSGGYQAFISPVEVDGRTMHRVRIGPFTEIDEARSMASKVEKAYQVDTWVTRSE